MKKIYFYIFLFFLCFFDINAFAVYDPNLRKWDVGSIDFSYNSGSALHYCSNITDGGIENDIFIGKQRGSCLLDGDSCSMMLMMAVETTEGGARFCPVVISPYYRDSSDDTYGNGDMWWPYFSFLDSGRCVWLCRKGFTGSTCEIDLDNGGKVKSCGTTLLKQANYDDMTWTGKEEDTYFYRSVPAFYDNGPYDTPPSNSGRAYYGCSAGLDKTSVKQLIFVINGWLKDGHGAKVRPYVVHPALYSRAAVQVAAYPLKNSNYALGCINGYKPNDDNTDCVAIDQSRCGEFHVIGKERMLYGKGSGNSPFREQCWPITNPVVKYKNCVLDGLK